MSFVVTAADREFFRRCRRQWDFGAGTRQNLEPARPPASGDLDRALRDALAVYYYPGMWDWDRGVRLPLVVQGLERAVGRQRGRGGGDAGAGWWQDHLDAGGDLLARYFAWAPAVDRFSPVLIEADYEVNVLDPVSPSAGLVSAAGEAIRYRGRIDMLAVDQHDAYWIVRHRLVDGDWLPTEQLAQDADGVLGLGAVLPRDGRHRDRLQRAAASAASIWAARAGPAAGSRGRPGAAGPGCGGGRRPHRPLPRVRCGSTSPAAEAGRFPSTAHVRPGPGA